MASDKIDLHPLHPYIALHLLPSGYGSSQTGTRGDVVASYKTLKPAPTSDFRKIRRYSKVLMQKLRRQILTPWTTDDYAVLSVAQGTLD